jgi:hypothetical protein
MAGLGLRLGLALAPTPKERWRVLLKRIACSAKQGVLLTSQARFLVLKGAMTTRPDFMKRLMDTYLGACLPACLPACAIAVLY